VRFVVGLSSLLLTVKIDNKTLSLSVVIKHY
jgi:hypothetical protein